MRRSILACGLLLAFAGLSAAVAAAAGSVGITGDASTATTTTTSGVAGASRTTVRDRSGGHTSAYWSGKARRAEATTKRWLTVVHGQPPRLRSQRRTLSSSSAQRARELAVAWRERAHTAWRHAHHPPMLRDWYCIHHYEGSWTDHGAPYWGGLQMDYSFQSAYGGWLLRHRGTADRWTPLEQIWVAVRAWRVRGFSPWPNTARDCGVY
jgi:hypothetical protein